MSCSFHPQWVHSSEDCPMCTTVKREPMSADAKVWKDDKGWHGIAEFTDNQIDMTAYGLTDMLEYIEEMAGRPLNWEIFEFKNGLGLIGYRAR